jgi:hypothetical protein
MIQEIGLKKQQQKSIILNIIIMLQQKQQQLTYLICFKFRRCSLVDNLHYGGG